jgi:hypothetical protein
MRYGWDVAAGAVIDRLQGSAFPVTALPQFGRTPVRPLRRPVNLAKRARRESPLILPQNDRPIPVRSRESGALRTAPLARLSLGPLITGPPLRIYPACHRAEAVVEPTSVSRFQHALSSVLLVLS